MKYRTQDPTSIVIHLLSFRDRYLIGLVNRHAERRRKRERDRARRGRRLFGYVAPELAPAVAISGGRWLR